MKILTDLTSPPSNIKPISVTIGNFDGVHLGHQELFKALRQSAERQHGHAIVITFQEHPSLLFKPDLPIQSLITQQNKLYLLQNEKIDLLYSIPFTQEFAQQTADQFLSKLHDLLNFHELILGHDAVIGRQRHGNRDVVLKIAENLGFVVTYLFPIKVGDTIVSSSQIRQKLQKGDLTAVQSLLGRPYSIRSTVKESKTGTINIDVTGLCLPPLGHYKVIVEHPQGRISGEANLSSNLLEIRLKSPIDLADKEIEVFL